MLAACYDHCQVCSPIFILDIAMRVTHIILGVMPMHSNDPLVKSQALVDEYRNLLLYPQEWI